MNPEMYAELNGSPQAARESRDLVRHMLGEDHPVADDAALVASELVSNAVIHTRSGQPGGMLIPAVKVSEHPAAVCIRVRDAGTLGPRSWPYPTPAASTAGDSPLSPLSPLNGAASPADQAGPPGAGSLPTRLPLYHPVGRQASKPASRSLATGKASMMPEAVPAETTTTSDRAASTRAWAREPYRDLTAPRSEAVATCQVIHVQGQMGTRIGVGAQRFAARQADASITPRPSRIAHHAMAAEVPSIPELEAGQ